MLMLISTALLPALVMLKFLSLWRRTSLNNERMKTLEAIAHIPSPCSRRALLHQLKRRMEGPERIFLELVLATPLGLVRNKRLLQVMHSYHLEFKHWYLLLCLSTITVVALGLLHSLALMHEGNILSALFISNDPSSMTMSMDLALTPLIFSLVLTSPPLLLMVLTRRWVNNNLQLIKQRVSQFCQIPAGLNMVIPIASNNRNVSSIKTRLEMV